MPSKVLGKKYGDRVSEAGPANARLGQHPRSNAWQLRRRGDKP